MARHIILAQSQCTATALRALLDLLGERVAESDLLIAPGEKLDVFERASAFIAHALAEEDRVIALVDSINLSALNPCASTGWDAAMAMLILAAPEVRWVFGVFATTVATENAEGSHRLQRMHGLASLFQEPFDALFDATGLRGWVRKRAVNDRTGLPFLKCAERTNLACALDDEEAYAYFHAYTAYRFGFRAIPVTREKLACSLLGKKASSAGAREQWANLGLADHLSLTFEDFFLNYPDRDLSEGWSCLTMRDQTLSALQQCGVLRAFVTTGQARGTDRDRRKANREHRRQLKRSGRLGSLVHKPIAGILDLWKESRLQRKHRRNRGYSEGFRWPPDVEKENNPADGHSAPGSLLLIALHLIDRAEALLDEVQSAKDAVRGAVLAMSAVELLEGKTPTTALEALALKHQFEVMAECQFYGVQSHFEVGGRIHEIRRELAPVGEYFHGGNRQCALWNAEAMILGKLIRAFDESQQFDESLIIQAHARRVHRRLWFKRVFEPRILGVRFPLLLGDELRWLNPFYWVATYTHGLLRSVPAFCVILILWISGLSLLFGSFNPTPKSSNRWAMGFQDALTSFFSVGGPIHEKAEPHPPLAPSADIPQRLDAIHAKLEDEGTVYTALVCLSIVGGFFHLGIFISHVYTIASRK
jgi:hypothetical protein